MNTREFVRDERTRTHQGKSLATQNYLFGSSGSVAGSACGGTAGSAAGSPAGVGAGSAPGSAAGSPAGLGGTSAVPSGASAGGVSPAGAASVAGASSPAGAASPAGADSSVVAAGAGAAVMGTSIPKAAANSAIDRNIGAPAPDSTPESASRASTSAAYALPVNLSRWARSCSAPSPVGAPSA